MNLCLNCGKIIKKNYSFRTILNLNEPCICDKCLQGLERVYGGCIRCGKKTTDKICEECLYWEKLNQTKQFILKNYSLFYYNMNAKTIINKIKFNGDLKLLLGFKSMVDRFIKKKKLKNICLIPIPVHENRLKERGFNQSLYIAKLFPFPILDVIKKQNNDKQSKKTRQGRMIFDNQFSLKEKIDLSNKNFMIIDDIYTTGATLHKVAKLLVSKPNQNIISFTLFRS